MAAAAGVQVRVTVVQQLGPASVFVTMDGAFGRTHGSSRSTGKPGPGQIECPCGAKRVALASSPHLSSSCMNYSYRRAENAAHFRARALRAALGVVANQLRPATTSGQLWRSFSIIQPGGFVTA